MFSSFSISRDRFVEVEDYPAELFHRIDLLVLFAEFFQEGGEIGFLVFCCGAG